MRLILYEVKRLFSHERSRLYFLYRSGYGAPVPSRPRQFARPVTTVCMSAVEKREKPPVDWELVLKRNPVERLKKEKAPLGIRDELPALIAPGYENVAEEDVVRLQWWGLYHDKPKIGTFMLRVKVPAGKLSPQRAARDRRDLEPLRQGRRRALDAAEHPAALARAREAARRLRAPRGRGHDHRRRLRRHRAQHHRLPRPGPRGRRALRRDAGRRRGGRRSSTATPTGPTCRASTSTRSPRAPTAATRRRSTASR